MLSISRHLPPRYLSAAILLWIGGCVSYQPEPLHPEKFQAAFMARSLSDPQLLAFVDRARTSATAPATLAAGTEAVTTSPVRHWDLNSLTRAAVYFHPDLDIARTHIWAMESGEISAGESPNPSLAIAPQFSTNPGDVSPWTVGFTFDFPIETAGKRDDRIAQAKALSQASRYELAEAIWHVRSRLRDALVEFLLDERAVELLSREVDARTHYLNLLDARLRAGVTDSEDIDAGRIDLIAAKQAWRAAQGERDDAKTKVAAAIGIPVAGLKDAAFDWPDLEQFGPVNPEITAPLQAAGLLNRLDVRRSLAEYAAAEAALKLEIAKQYPDLHLGPGYTFDQGQNKWELGLSLDLPIINQNAGAIAQAKAHRAELAARFLALQAQVIGETESALARLASAIDEVKDTQDELASFERKQTAGRRALEVGEQDRLTLTGLEVQSAVTGRLQVEALRKAHLAQGALEDALQRPLPVETPATHPATGPANREDHAP